MPANRKIPVTVLTGFLGSGKTTLLNHLLRGAHGKRIAVIENEFGAVPIDNDLVISAKEELFELKGGCMCCTVRADLIRIVDDLTKRTDFDHIILETTGLADPAPVAQTFFVEEGIRDRATLDAVVTVVDAKTVLRHIDESRACLDQIAFADLLLLNKCDLATPAELDAVEARLRAINGIARIQRVTRGQAPVDEVLRRGGFDLERALESKPAFLQAEYPFAQASTFELEAGPHELRIGRRFELAMGVILVPDDKPMRELERDVSAALSVGLRVTPPGRRVKVGAAAKLRIDDKGVKRFKLDVPAAGRYALFTQGRTQDFGVRLFVAKGRAKEPSSTVDYIAGHLHDREVTSVSLTDEGVVDSARLRAWLDELIHEQGERLYRAKGIFDDGGPERLVIHAVHELLEVVHDRPWREGEARGVQMVLIGRALDDKALRRGLEGCRVRRQRKPARRPRAAV